MECEICGAEVNEQPVKNVDTPLVHRESHGCGRMRNLELAKADVRILIAAMTLIALLVVLLLNDSLDTYPIAPAWLPFPVPLP
jgi:hypothetical protein